MIICTGALPWIDLDLLQWKTQCLFTYIRPSFVNHYFPVEFQKLYLSRHGFVNVQNWKNSVKKLNITIMFPFLIYLRFIITLAKGVFDWKIDKKKNTQICLKWIKIVKKTTALSQNILHVDALYNIRRKKYKTVCAELAFAKVTFDKMVMIFIIELVMVSLFAMQLDYCNIQIVFDQK